MADPIDYGNFATQFLLVSSAEDLPSDLPEGWSAITVGSSHLAHGPDLPVLVVGSRCLLGWPVDLDTQDGLFRDDLLGLESTADLLEHLAGRFLLLGFIGPTVHAHPDPGGGLSAFHHPESGILASSPALIESIFAGRYASLRPVAEREALLHLREQTGTWYPAGLCQLADWTLLRPNHRTLLLSSTESKPERTWPNPNTSQTDSQVASAKTITGLLSGILTSLSKIAPLEIPLSAGRDSRLLLACSRDFHRDVRYSVHSPIAPHRAPEVEVSSALAEVLDLDHHIDQPRDPNRILCMGYGGEVVRGHYSTTDGDKADPLAILGYFGTADIDIGFVEQAMADWANQLDGIPESLHPDLIYLEQRMATTMSAALYRDDLDCHFAVAPLCSQRLYDQVFSLPQDYRVGWTLSDDIFRHAWPATQLVPLQKTYFTGREKLHVRLRLLSAPFRGPDFRRAWRSPLLRQMIRMPPPGESEPS